MNHFQRKIWEISKLIPPRDSSKKGTVTRSKARGNPTLAKEIEETSQGPPKLKRKNQQNAAVQ